MLARELLDEGQSAIHGGYIDMASVAQASKVAERSGLDIHLSSWVSWACYGLGFGLALHLAPQMAQDLRSGGPGLCVLAGSVVGFFALVLSVQHQMSVSLRNTRFGEPRKLVTAGWFGISRNPMYVAFLMPILSIAWFSPLSAAAAAILYVMAMNTLVIAGEEEVLEASFGQSFRTYKRSTPRWLLWI